MQNGYGDPREALGTLFYHDHTLDFTGPNVYRGISGFYLLFDDLDSGNERDQNPGALRLPSHPYDYHWRFPIGDSTPREYFILIKPIPEGVLGDKSWSMAN